MTICTHRYTHRPQTLMRCLLTHLVKVFFCTRSRSSERDKPGYLGLGRSPRSPQEVTTMHTPKEGLRITLRPNDPGPAPRPQPALSRQRGGASHTRCLLLNPHCLPLEMGGSRAGSHKHPEAKATAHKSQPAPPPHAALRRPEQSGPKIGPRTGHTVVSGELCPSNWAASLFHGAESPPTTTAL